MDAQIDAAARELVMHRTFAAPVSLMFKMWTRPEHMARWWGCAGSNMVSAKNDLRVGGQYRVEMTVPPDGAMHIITGAYLEIAEPRTISFTWAWEDPAGNLGHQTEVTVTLEEVAEGTLMTLHQLVFETPEMCNLHREGWTASFERLTDYAPGAS